VRTGLRTLVAGAARRPRLAIAAVVVLALAGGLLALRLQPSTSLATLVSRSSPDFRATDLDAAHFGGDAVVIMVTQPLRRLLGTSDLATVSALEACLAGQRFVLDSRLQALMPASGPVQPYGGARSPCGALMRARPVQVVYGPGTFLNRAVAAIGRRIVELGAQDRAAVEAAQRAAYALAIRKGLRRSQAVLAASTAGELEAERQLAQLILLATGSGLVSAPAIGNAAFVEGIVLDPARPGVPRARLHWLFPTSDAALIEVRLRAGLSATQEARAIALIRAAVRMPRFALSGHGRYLVSGEPVVLGDLATSVSSSIALLLIGSVAAMALALLAVFRGSLSLLPLVLALCGAAITFGLVELAGATLTMASVAVLPILIGLAVDYAIQFQSRARELPASVGGAERVREASAAGSPAIIAAALATAAGLAALLLSPVPMVRGFGLLLIVGVAVALVVTLVAGPAAIVIGAGGGPARHGGAWLGPSLRGAAEILALAARPLGGVRRPRPPRPSRPPRPPRPPRFALGGLLELLMRHPRRTLAAGAVLAAAGWVASTQAPVQSDVTRLVPASMPALRDLRALERVTGSSGEIDLLVHAPDVLSPGVLAWMTRVEGSLLRQFGYTAARGCAAATLCPALSLPDLLGGAAGGAEAKALLDAVPAYFTRAVVTPDHRYAVLAFGIRLMPLSTQQRVIAAMRAQLHPPSGTTASLAGLPVIAADAAAALSSAGRRLLTALVGLLAAGLALTAFLRAPRRALVPLASIVLAAGWSWLFVPLIGIPLNPMSVTLATLVIAISTEFSVLLSERVEAERAGAGSLAEAVERAYRSTGSAVLASGVTAVAGFGVLALSDIRMLRDFGLLAVADLAVALAGVLLILPATVAVAP
jgi:predicted RND superfamily exporter protein